MLYSLCRSPFFMHTQIIIFCEFMVTENCKFLVFSSCLSVIYIVSLTFVFTFCWEYRCQLHSLLSLPQIQAYLWKSVQFQNFPAQSSSVSSSSTGGLIKIVISFPSSSFNATAVSQTSFNLESVAYFLLYTLSYTDFWNWLSVIITN